MNIHTLLVIAKMFLLPLIIVLIPIYLGQRYGTYRKKKAENLQEAPVGTVVGSAFGLLAFMIAFTFQIVYDFQVLIQALAILHQFEF